MHYLLSKILERRKVKRSDLTQEERVDFDRWEKILSEDELTVEKIKTFCKNQLGIIDLQLRNLDNTEKKQERLLMCHIVYSAIIQAIDSPSVERETLEKYLNELLTK